MKRSLFHFNLLLIFVLCLSAGFVQNLFSQETIQIVESVPVETNLGISETARTLDVWLDMIKGAEISLDIGIFYLSNEAGEPLEEVISALKSAAERKVKVRMIVDAKFYNIYPQTLDELNKIANIEVRKIAFFNEMDGVQHAKYFIADAKEIFLGSQNYDWRSLKHIHELGVRVHQPKLAELLLSIFEMDWQLCQSKDFARNIQQNRIPDKILINSDYPVTVNWEGETVSIFPTISPNKLVPQGLEKDEGQILNLINNAKEKVYIQLLSYEPAYRSEFYPAIDNALRAAAVRGVQIKLMVSDWNKRQPGIQFLKSLQVIPNIEVKLSTVPPYSGGFIPFARVKHCKFMLVDDSLSWVGTSNWAKNYFYNSRNLGLVFRSRKVNDLIEKVFLKSWESSHTYFVDPSEDYEPPRIGE
jgi:phosphatidylserine/phosphatidylglycerophosphate/cardiolipin synthase-like enzyme